SMHAGSFSNGWLMYFEGSSKSRRTIFHVPASLPPHAWDASACGAPLSPMHAANRTVSARAQRNSTAVLVTPVSLAGNIDEMKAGLSARVLIGGEQIGCCRGQHDALRSVA